MDRDAVIALLERRGGLRGRTAMQHNADFRRAGRLTFVRCSGSDDPEYNCEEYVAVVADRSPLYICRNKRTGIISCSPKGYFCFRQIASNV
jgi:hypothetical protein